MVEIPDWRSGAAIVAEQGRREVRTFQMLRPRALETMDADMDDLQIGDLPLRELVAHGDDEVDVAVLVEVADGERPLEVGAHERLAECVANVVHEGAEDGVQLR